MISVITAVPARSELVGYLRSHIPSAYVVWDGGLGAMETFRRAWRMFGGVAHIKLQDDVILCRDFLAKAQAVIDQHPNVPIQFFSRRKADITVGSRWLPGSVWMMNQAHYLPAGMAGALADFAETWEGYAKDPTGDDTLMADFFRTRKIRYWNHCPSLVDHAPVVSQINPKRSRSRDSLTFTDPEFRNYPVIP